MLNRTNLIIIILLFPSILFARIIHFSLKNGLDVYLCKMGTLPVVSINVVYRAGCKDEHNGITGIAHMLEHMNYRGSKHFKDGFIERYVILNGGEENAMTSFDYTRYYAVVNNKALPTILRVYADNMEYLTLNRKKFLKERNVVYQERLWRVDNSPDGYLYYLLHELAFLESQYRWTPIGFASDILSWTRDDVYRFYKKYYAPNNAAVVICGNFDIKRVKSLIKKYFGKFRKKKIKFHFNEEPPQKGERIANLKFVSSNKKLAMAFHIPPLSDNSTPVLDVITYMLFARENSILKKKLIREKKLCSSIYGGNEERLHSGLYMIFATLNRGVKFKRVEKVIWQELKNLKEGKFSDRDFNFSKKRAIYDYMYSKETVEDLGSVLSFYAALNRVEYFENYRKLIEGVKRKDIINFARKIFNRTNATIIHLYPKKGKSINITPNISGALR